MVYEGRLLLDRTRIPETKISVASTVVEMSENKHGELKKALFAFALSLLTPGLGQFFAGRPARACLVYGAGFFPVCLLLSGMYFTFAGFCSWIAIFALYVLFNCIDAFRLAGETRSAARGANPKIFVCPALAVPHFALAACVFSYALPVKPYCVPTSSMAPALLPGDFFLAELRDGRGIRRGDVVVFSSPSNENVAYVKRVVGLPGETVETVGGRLWIDGARLSEPYMEQYRPARRMYGRDRRGPSPVPEGSFYALGDNRADSLDSRHYGPVRLENIEGKALFVVWSKDPARIGRRVR